MDDYLKTLHAWLEEGHIPIENDAVFDWIKQQSRETWHSIACNWNWDDGSEELLWMVSQPECDFGTGFQIFFTEATNWLTTLNCEELAAGYRDNWKTCQAICDRWQANDFTMAEFTPQLEKRGSADKNGSAFYKQMAQNVVNAGNDLAWHVPEYVYDYLGARQASSDHTWVEGRPFLSMEAWKRKTGLV